MEEICRGLTWQWLFYYLFTFRFWYYLWHTYWVFLNILFALLNRLWGTFLADLVIQMLGTDYARILRTIYALAQVRCSICSMLSLRPYWVLGLPAWPAWYDTSCCVYSVFLFIKSTCGFRFTFSFNILKNEAIVSFWGKGRYWHNYLFQFVE